tara:strand:+ start:129 stop:377 length:249 start_codon:yes stop_codon:yes gene_type:complete
LNRLSIAFGSLLLPLLLLGCDNHSKKEAEMALFKTRSEAENAAPRFNCQGAHKMGDLWMPCEKHSKFEKEIMHDNHGYNHSH